MANPVKSTPRDSQVMAAILKDAGVTEYEPRLIHQMLEFTYSYVTDVLEDARTFSQHANKKTVDLDDVRFAVQCKTNHSFTNPPPKEMLQELARQKNSQPLPPIKPYGGPRSLPDRYCLTNPNYKLKTSKKPPSRIQFGLPTQQRLSMPSQAKSLTMKGLGSTGGQSLTVLPKAGPSGAMAANQVTIISKPALSATAKPTIRINTGPTKPSFTPKPAVAAATSAVGIGASGLAQIVTQTTPTPSTPATPATTPSLLPTSIIAPSTTPTGATTISTTTTAAATPQGLPSAIGTFNPLKRKAEDDDYDA